MDNVKKYLNDWFNVIENMNNDNTYKLAWGRALIECITQGKCYVAYDTNQLIVEFDEISKCMIKYYWNQTFFFNLKQAPYKDKEPVICRETNRLIQEYKNITLNSIPVWHDKGINIIKNNNLKLYDDVVKKVSKTLHENVCWRFKIVNKESINLYEYDKSLGSKAIFDYNDAMVLKEYGVIISQLLNYKWAQLLEKFNFAAKIANKVNGISNEQIIKRSSLEKYKEELIKQFEDGNIIDFYTGESLTKKEATVDHVIPWSFMYSDDIWNLVLTSRSNNSSKSNTIPNEEVIEKLKERNQKLLDILDGKYKDDLLMSIENGYVDKFYFDCRL